MLARPSLEEYLYAAGVLVPGAEEVEKIKHQYLSTDFANGGFGKSSGSTSRYSSGTSTREPLAPNFRPGAAYPTEHGPAGPSVANARGLHAPPNVALHLGPAQSVLGAPASRAHSLGAAGLSHISPVSHSHTQSRSFFYPGVQQDSAPQSPAQRMGTNARDERAWPVVDLRNGPAREAEDHSVRSADTHLRSFAAEAPRSKLTGASLTTTAAATPTATTPGVDVLALPVDQPSFALDDTAKPGADGILEKARAHMQRQDQLRQSADALNLSVLEQELRRLQCLAESEQDRAQALAVEVETLQSERDRLEMELKKQEVTAKASIHEKYFAWQQDSTAARIEELERIVQEKDQGLAELCSIRSEMTAEIAACRDVANQHARRHAVDLREAQLAAATCAAKLNEQRAETERAQSAAQAAITEIESAKRRGEEQARRLDQTTTEFKEALRVQEEKAAAELSEYEKELEKQKEIVKGQLTEHAAHVGAMQKAHEMEMAEFQTKLASAETAIEAKKESCTALEDQIARRDEALRKAAIDLEEFRVAHKRYQSVKLELAQRQNDLEAARAQGAAEARALKSEAKEARAALERAHADVATTKEEVVSLRKKRHEEKAKWLADVAALRECSNEHAAALLGEIDVFKRRAEDRQRDAEAARAEWLSEKEALQKAFALERQEWTKQAEERRREDEERIANLLADAERQHAGALESSLAAQEKEHEERYKTAVLRHSDSLQTLEARVQAAASHSQQLSELELQKKTAEFQIERERLERRCADLQEAETKATADSEKTKRELESDRRQWRDKAEQLEAEQRTLKTEATNLQEEVTRLRDRETELENERDLRTRLEDERTQFLASIETKDLGIAQLEEKVQTTLAVYESKLRSVHQQKDFECNSVSASVRSEYEDRLREMEQKLKKQSEEKTELEKALEVLALQHHELVADKKALTKNLDQLRRAS
ncbi:unnamed protein product [Amoebophrya sp. A25]|nr:unnamed protein product [Amoebophrya sp. A25]|eukprot:GSA25T00019010001.1